MKFEDDNELEDEDEAENKENEKEKMNEFIIGERISLVSNKAILVCLKKSIFLKCYNYKLRKEILKISKEPFPNFKGDQLKLKDIFEWNKYKTLVLNETIKKTKRISSFKEKQY